MFGFEDNGFSDEEERLQQLLNRYRQVQQPSYEEQIAEMWTPETANYELIKEDPVTRSKQLSVLERMAGLAESGLSDADRAGFEDARQMASQVARGNSQAALQNAENRGVAGSGLEFAMREIGNQGAADRARAGGMDVAKAAAQNRILYNNAFSQGLDNLRSADSRTATQNTNIINDFNMKNTNARNNANQWNINNRADVRDSNNELEDRRYNNQLSRLDRESGVQQQINGVRSARDQRRRGGMGAIGGIAGGAIGAYFGGPAGAAAGYQLGNSFGQNL